MARRQKCRLLVNLPPGFFQCPQLKGVFARLRRLATLRQRSHNQAEEIARDLAWADAVIMWGWPTLTPELLARAPRLRFAGHLNLNQAGARAELEHGLAVSEARRGWSPAVAEMALALTLSGLRRLSDYHAAMRAGTEHWVSNFPLDIDPTERQLTGRAVGIVGFGGIGQRLAELLAPFHVALRTYDPFLPKAVAKRFGARLVGLMELCRESEIVVLCAANNAGTHHLLGKKEIAALQRNALLVNVGRAWLVDMQALEQRLRKGDLFAALDVFEKEPLEKDSPLRTLPNAWLTPHRAGAPMESVVRIVTMLVDDFEAFLRGRPRQHALTLDMLHCLHG
ncbi:MAG TPA: NAD(P)-dependent oxidoreductase [Planctomycetota bacterium]|nr:NAD(P)-dependent oxidoreductase [Planctomycetota bacterium]HRR81592.1 NAD(P)-dependent oxidoreductase [Planctomycetota bacterium]HRT94855.1 NAD(P)-dependent oxidoreductase [Planctomycetota bacterium]